MCVCIYIYVRMYLEIFVYCMYFKIMHVCVHMAFVNLPGAPKHRPHSLEHAEINFLNFQALCDVIGRFLRNLVLSCNLLLVSVRMQMH